MNRGLVRVPARPNRRRGTATIELAVCLPLLTLLVFGSIEASSLIFLKQSLSVAAYEAARVAIIDGKSNLDASHKAEVIMRARHLEKARIDFPEGESLDIHRGRRIVAEATAPLSANSPLLGRFLSERVVSARVVMLKQ